MCASVHCCWQHNTLSLLLNTACVYYVLYYYQYTGEPSDQQWPISISNRWTHWKKEHTSSQQTASRHCHNWINWICLIGCRNWLRGNSPSLEIFGCPLTRPATGHFGWCPWSCDPWRRAFACKISCEYLVDIVGFVCVSQIAFNYYYYSRLIIIIYTSRVS